MSNLLLFALLAAGTPAHDSSPHPAAAPTPRNVVLFIADGFGPASATLARQALGEPLALDGILVGTCGTAPAVGLVTDSAAAATALACGFKTVNGAVSVDPQGKPFGTLLEAAEARGLATGMVVTCRLTHATPACFGAHALNRGQEDSIAAQLLEQEIELLLGGGARHFLPRGAGGTRDDGRDLLAEARGAGVTVLGDFEGLEGELALPVLGVFASDHLPYELDRDPAGPDLAALVKRALELLAPSETGFFLMVEGSRIDHAGHQNDAAAHLAEILAYDRAVAAALAFARADGDTLVVATADHETGGLTLGRNVDGRAFYGWYPRVLERVGGSLEAVYRRSTRAPEPESAALAELGVEDASDGERAALREALAGDLDAFLEVASELVNRRAVVAFTTWGHTAVDVGLYASGPGAERFFGWRDNVEIPRLLEELLALDLDAVTARLRAR